MTEEDCIAMVGARREDGTFFLNSFLLQYRLNYRLYRSFAGHKYVEKERGVREKKKCIIHHPPVYIEVVNEKNPIRTSRV